MYSGRGEEEREQLETAECQSEGQTKTDNGQIAREMVERQRGTHTIQRDKLRALRDSKCQNKREEGRLKVVQPLS